MSSNSAGASVHTFTVANGASRSDSKDLGGAAPLRIFTPSALESGTVAVGFEVSPANDGNNWYFLRDDTGTIVTVTVDPAAAQCIDVPIDPHGKGYGNLRLVLMDSAPAAKSQSASRTLTVEVR